MATPNFDCYYRGEVIDSEFFSKFNFLETNNQTNSNSRFYNCCVHSDEYIFHVSNIKNDRGLAEYGLSHEILNSEWQKLNKKDFNVIKKVMGNELENQFDMITDMIKTSKSVIYENNDSYLIHIPEYSFRILGPQYQYTYSFDDDKNVKLYIIKTSDNNYNLNKINQMGFTQSNRLNIHAVLSIWSSFLGFLLSETKYL